MAKTVDVVTPTDQEGTEAVVLRWFKQAGESVTEHEPLLELETDKVTVEIPSPATGTLLEVLRNQDEAVEPGTVLARIAVGAAAGRRIEAARVVAIPAAPSTANDELLSPAVRRLLNEHGLKSAQIPATGKNGRLTAQDVALYLERRDRATPESTRSTAPEVKRSAAPEPTRSAASAPEAPRSAPASQPGRAAQSQHVPHSPIRRRIAAHMTESVATAPHVTTLFEADLTRVVAHRRHNAGDFESRGVKLTFTAYFVAAAVKALQAVPEINSRFHAASLEFFSDCNIGVGTALGNEGLIVPVIHRAQDLDLFGIAQRLGELVSAARAGKLSQDAVRGGTFTISNHGVSGSLLAAPIIINQPQVAIMGVGKIERRLAVQQIDGVDSVSVRPMCYLTLTIDHRALDAFQANSFLGVVVEQLQSWQPPQGT